MICAHLRLPRGTSRGGRSIKYSATWIPPGIEVKVFDRLPLLPRTQDDAERRCFIGLAFMAVQRAPVEFHLAGVGSLEVADPRRSAAAISASGKTAANCTVRRRFFSPNPRRRGFQLSPHGGDSLRSVLCATLHWATRAPAEDGWLPQYRCPSVRGSGPRYSRCRHLQRPRRRACVCRSGANAPQHYVSTTAASCRGRRTSRAPAKQ